MSHHTSIQDPSCLAHLPARVPPLRCAGRGTGGGVLLLIALCLAGCVEPPAPADPARDNPGDTNIYVPPTMRLPNRTCLAPAKPPAPGDVALVPAFAGEFPAADANKLIDLRFAPGEPGRWFVVHQDARIHTFVEGQSGTSQIALDIGERTYLEHRETGLTSMALHPDFANNGHAFVVYAAPGAPRFVSRVSRFTSTDGATFDPDSEQIIIEVPQDVGIHNGNHIAFGPDGHLHYSVGDGATLRLRAMAPDPNTFYGKILRIDVDNPDPERGTPYGIPADNPFAQGGGAPEVFAYGLRNPWRFSFDSETGDLWVGDVGQDSWEEISKIVPGGHHGWPIVEGTECFEAETCDPTGTVLPVWVYGHDEGRSVTAGTVYRGNALPQLRGRFVFADFFNGTIWALSDTPDGPLAEMQIESGYNLASITEGPEGELYMVRYDRGDKGGIYRLAPADPVEDNFPKLLTTTGCVDPDDPRLPADGLIPYEVRSALWSDSADKDRFFALPDDKRIAIGPEGDLLLPVGSVILKHFRFGDAFLETRLLIHHEEGWSGYTYEWREDQSDARLLDFGKSLDLESGLRWVFPSRSQCTACHTTAVERVVGLELSQLDFEVTHPDGSVGNQVDWMMDHEIFGADLIDRTVIGENLGMPDPFDEEIDDLEVRARAYLHANCAHCHQPEGTTARGDLDLRFATDASGVGACNVEPEHGYPWYVDGGRTMSLLVPGDPDQSILLHRMETLTLFRMPTIGSRLVHDEAVALIRAWIEELQMCP